MIGNFMDLLTKKAPEFPEGYTWINTKEPLSLSKLKGHVVILDFWTYCCINCMHVLPILAQIEEKYKDKPVVVIGVHSAKFKNEENADNVRQAVYRYEMDHPVVVDQKRHIWNEYFISAWPTTIIIGPTGRIAFKLSGEYSLDQMTQLIDDVLRNSEQDGTLAKKKIRIEVSTRRKSKSSLSFPGKMSFSKDHSGFALSDSNNNRILIIETKTGRIISSIGSGKKGLTDGPFAKASFSRPQGVLWMGNKIYVADTENHAIREIDLDNDTVKTIAGTGQKGVYVEHNKSYPAKATRLNSPWDLASDGKSIFIAMAGLHQIWSYDIKKQKLSVFAGRGSENITDGNAESAEFAQPSGLWLDKGTLYIADSEVSAVRALPLDTKYASTIVGEGLFAFGDGSGSLSSTKLQHPLGITVDRGTIYVADTFNSTIKAIDPKKGTVENVIGNKLNKSVCRFDDPECDSLLLYEPSDVKINRNDIYIVDTNNHLVRKFNIKDKILKTLKIR